MSFTRTFVSGLIAATVALGSLAATTQQSSAKKLSPGEAAAIAGVGGFILGAALAQPRYYDEPVYHAPHQYKKVKYYGYNSHVAKCFAKYKSYDPETDTYLGYDGYRRYCNL